MTLHPPRKTFTTVERGDTHIPIRDVLVHGELELYPDVVSKKYFTVSLRGNNIAFVAGDHVGYIPLNSRVAILVEPKTGRNNWLHIVGKAKGYLKELHYLRTYERNDDISHSLLEFLVRALLIQLIPVERHGLLKQYQPFREITSFPNGRILFNESIKRVWSHGKLSSVNIQRYELTKNNAFNHLIKQALSFSAQFILALPQRNQDLIRLISEAENLFASVSMDATFSYLPKVYSALREGSFPDTRFYYEDVCRTALLIVENSGLLPYIEKDERTLAFTVDMADVFQNYCFALFTENAAMAQWRHISNANEGRLRLFSGEGVDPRYAEPDITVVTSTGLRYPIEIKYKSDPTRADINQAVTYGLAYKTNKALLLCFSDGTKSGIEYLGRVGDLVDLWVYRLQLDSPNIEDVEQRAIIDIRDVIVAENKLTL